MEQIRIVKEMRERERSDRRTGELVRPRYMVWENVPGALSSNGGNDFAAVLEEIIKIAELEAPHIQVPEHGWPTWGGYRDVGGRWSVAYRIHDAQWYGVPQRRRRISVVADFGGSTAHEILFEPCSMSGNPTESGTSRERPAGAVESGSYPAVARSLTARYDGSPCVDRGPNRICANPWDAQSARLYDADGIYASLNANSGGGQNRAAVFCMATQQGGAEIRADDKAPMLTAAAGMSGNNQPTVYCLQGNGIDRADTAGCNGKGWREDVSYTLNTVDRPAVCAGFKLGNSEKSRSIGYGEEKSPTLNAESGGNKPAVLQAYSFDSLASNSMKSKNPNSGCRTVDCAKTLDTAPPDPSKNQGGIVILDMTHANDVIRECGEVAPSLQARMGTGGNQVPLTYQMQGFGDYREGKVASNCKQRDYKDSTDLVYAVDCRNFTENGNVNGTLQAKESGGSSLNLNNVCRLSGTVRRLTPLECTRLQGFPDGWVDIGEWTDEKGRVHKEADAPKYKALGNSIALPFWKWLLGRISEYLPAGATLGSLFDGIGGFPLCWAEINGAESCRWASEIEQFPIAVVKRHFGDEDANIAGDIKKFLGGGIGR